MKKSPSTSRALTLRQERALSAKEFLDLADVPPEVEWFANITNPQTRRAYQNDLSDFMRFAGIQSPEEFRVVTRAHVIAWRKDLEGRAVADSTIRRKLSALSSLFEYLCERNAVMHNPVDGVKRPKANRLPRYLGERMRSFGLFLRCTGKANIAYRPESYINIR